MAVVFVCPVPMASNVFPFSVVCESPPRIHSIASLWFSKAQIKPISTFPSPSKSVGVGAI
jgi:hypothetical protein